MNEQRETLEKALLALEIAPLDHNSVKSSFFEKRHYAIIALREALAEPDQELEFWPGDVLICKEDDSKVTVVNGNRGSLQLMNGKIAIAWNDSVFGEYTVEQVKEMFYHAEKPEQEPVAWLSEGGDVSRSKRYMDEMGFICEPLYTAPPAREPLTDIELWKMWVESPSDVLRFARAIERAHGIGEA